MELDRRHKARPPAVSGLHADDYGCQLFFEAQRSAGQGPLL